MYFILMIPLPDSKPTVGADKTPFIWNQNEFWTELENSFKRYREIGCDSLVTTIDSNLKNLSMMVDSMNTKDFDVDDPYFDRVEFSTFFLSPLIAACTGKAMDFIEVNMRLRNLVKNQSVNWNLSDRNVRDKMYRLLYGSRAAVEEIILQLPESDRPAWLRGINEPSDTRPARLNGVLIQSGDILVSRGGAPTSALISRGNDYPGNFSHVAFAYVDSNYQLKFIESHIETGVIIANPDEYLNDTKLRILVLRPRYELLKYKFNNTNLPDEAARIAFDESQSRHIPYDFKLNFYDHSEMFCSEVVYFAYHQLGLNLWMGMTTISSPGIVDWLSDFGVEYFESHEPADLEYDPQLVVVSEWRDPALLLKDHVDNAAMDVMLEDADKGEKLDYNIFMLPFARVIKAYSWILNQFGEVGPIPEGMDAVAGLKNEFFSEIHKKISDELLQSAKEFKDVNGYTPPYWELVNKAREIKNKLN